MENEKIVFYELNEVPYRVFDHFADLMPRSSLSKIKKMRGDTRHTRRTVGILALGLLGQLCIEVLQTKNI